MSYAIIAFCPDLADPDQNSKPVGIVGLLQDEKPRIFIGVAQPPEELAQDPVCCMTYGSNARQLLSALQALVDNVDVDNILEELKRVLRGNLHVAEIKRDLPAQGEKLKDLADYLFDLSQEVGAGLEAVILLPLQPSENPSILVDA